MKDLASADAYQLGRSFAARELTPVEVAQAVFERMDRWEPAIHAMFLVHRKAALAQALASELRWQAGKPLSPIDGVPVTIKENLYTAGDPAPLGVAIGSKLAKVADSPPAARLREAGCVILGKTTMPDYGMLSSGLSSMHGLTRNPWRLDCNPAGSSSGAGAAGAAGYGPLHIGTDIGGSVRLPANHCGLFGLKPSLGRVPIDPPYMGRAAGPMTRTVTDAAMMLDVLSRPDGRDFMALPFQPGNFVAGLDSFALKGVRIGLLTDMKAGMPVAPGVVQTIEAAAAALAAAGAVVEPVGSFMTPAMLDGMCRFFEARSGVEVAALSDAERAKILPFIVEWATWRSGGFSGADVMGAYTQIMAMREAAVRCTARHDFLLSPVAPIVSYGAEQHSPSDDPHDALSHIAFTVAWNMSEQPAASINWHHVDGMPVGVQVVGQRFDDLGVLRVARAIEQLRPAQAAWPTPPAA